MTLFNQLLDYYNNFFNNSYLREFRLLSEKYPTYRGFIKSEDPKDIAKILKRILSKDKGNTNIYSEIYSFKNWNEFIKNQNQIAIKNSKKKYDFSKDKPLRIYDRLYFDFDLEKNTELSNLKQDINKAIKTNDKATKKDLIKDYYNILLNNEVAKEPFEELQKLYSYLNDKGIKSYPLFSGAKGFHLYIYFKPSLFNAVSFNSVATGVFNLFKDTLNLKTLDKAVFENPSQRIARLPYFKHSISELYCYPIAIADSSYTDIIEYANKPKIELFNIDTHISNNENIELLNYITSNIKEENHKQDQLAKLEVKRKQLQKEKDLKLSKNRQEGYKEVEKDCIVIANEFLGSPERTFSNYVTYKCFNHNDNKPSLTVYRERFYCAVCGFNLNYLDFVMLYTGANEKEAMRILLNRC